MKTRNLLSFIVCLGAAAQPLLKSTLVLIGGSLLLLHQVSAQNVLVGPRTTTVDRVNIEPAGIQANTTYIFNGDVIVTVGQAVNIGAIPPSTNFSINPGVTISTTDSEGFLYNDVLRGSFLNQGKIISTNDNAAAINSDIRGTFINRGTIDATNGDHGVFVSGELDTGARFTNDGTIIGKDDGVYFDGNDLDGIFTNNGTIIAVDNEGVDLDNLGGTLINNGTIRVGGVGIEIERNFETGALLINSGSIIAGNDGIDVDDNFRGVLINNGSIISEGNGIDINLNFESGGSLTNSGSIIADNEGIVVRDNFSGTLMNQGSIEGNIGIEIQDAGTGTILNDDGTIIGRNGTAVALGSDNGTFIFSGVSRIQGILDGEGGGGDTLQFRNLRGVSPETIEQLKAFAAANGDGTISLFGETVSWINFENILVDLSSIQSFQNLITTPGLEGYAVALDNILDIDNPEFRAFFEALGDLNGDQLEEAVRNSSGQTTISAFTDLLQSQNTALFHQLMGQMGSFRSGSGGGFNSQFSLTGRQDNAAMDRLQSKLIALDAQGVSDVSTIDRASVETASPQRNENHHVFINGYGSISEQDDTSFRSESETVSTSTVLGGGSWLTENLYVGGFGGYSGSKTTFDAFGSEFESDTGYIGGTVQGQIGNFFANFVAAYGYHNLESSRIDFMGNVLQGERDGHQFMTYTQLGYDWTVGKSQTTKITPYVGAAYSVA
jgi:hypothetical protein